ncbi:MAG: hypothetical protein JSU74_13410 [Candidatus Zixiibacteriota bacterium]|nr:MAG: hypothetical protein JSU74_13410 [candidate division Zixibacteria bacterium]
MNRKPILTVLICYCLVALVLAMLGVAALPSAAAADGGGDPPHPPSDSTLDASNPTESTPVPDAEPMPEKSLTLRMYLEIVVGTIL